MEQKKKYKNKNLFDYLKNIIHDKSDEIYKKHISEADFESSFSCFMILNYLSMSPHKETRDFIIKNQIYLEKMNQNILYRFLIKEIPYNNNYFIRYIK